VFSRLYIKLSISLVLVFVVIGALLLAITRNAMDRYSQAVTQRMNESVAMYVTDEMQLIADGVANADALKQLAHHAMIINPSIEVYLLDRNGKILSHALPPQQVLRNTVALQPIKTFLSARENLPLLGDDPSNLGSKKVFSANEVRFNNQLEGYVYIVLEGKKREQLADSVYSSQVFQFSALALVACLAFGLICALIIFARFSRRLEALTHKTEQFYADIGGIGLGDAGYSKPLPTTTHDELDRLGMAVDAMQSRINLQMQQIKQSDDMRRELIANISHDLRTPLTNMLGYIETLLLKHDELDAKQQQDYLKITRKHGKKLGRLIADLFELAKLDSNAIEPQMETFSIAELIQDVAQDFRIRAQKKQIRLQIDGDMDDARVCADIGLMERVIDNLLDNALRHTPAGGEIRVDIAKQPDGVQVRIADDGEGIDPQDLPYIFDRFFHVRDSEQEELKSTGLGLAIVKRILDLHFSRITVESSLQQGTRFEFCLPSVRLS
jgi:signal transduction histidine kinase